MGYLSDNLPFGRGIADCPSFYIYAMFIYFTRRDKYAADAPQSILAKTILAVLPDVEDWQVSIIRNDHVVFRFHDPAQRQLASNAVINTTPVELAVSKVTFSQVGSTVLPSGQVFPAPPPPPPPFPDLGPIITDLETRVHQLEIEEDKELITWLQPALNFAGLPTVGVVTGSVAITLDSGFMWQFNGTMWVLQPSGSAGFQFADFGVGSLNPISSGQTTFLLPGPPGSTVFGVLNGELHYPPFSFTIAGNNITWLNPPVAGRPLVLDANDRLRFYF